MSELCTVHAYVSGKVQGVWFRAFTREQALACDVTGWAKNLADGRVEVMLSGNVQDIERVVKALHDGPELSKVSALESEIVSYQVFEGFVTG